MLSKLVTQGCYKSGDSYSSTRAQHNDTLSSVMWNVGIQPNVIDNNKMQSYKLACN
jgi:hypothetical protein